MFTNFTNSPLIIEEIPENCSNNASTKKKGKLSNAPRSKTPGVDIQPLSSIYILSSTIQLPPSSPPHIHNRSVEIKMEIKWLSASKRVSKVNGEIWPPKRPVNAK
ncbi:hypothetical protein VTN00DRAFT_505 [Thermoascus crustaceus]|uniref:uncharacterized protein n=1 Tax=Thermoascus crustaceus TaxID=5088 RepID=UPI00374492CD